MNSINYPAFSTTEVSNYRSQTKGCKFVNHLNNAGSGLMPDVVTKAIINHILLESEIGGYEAAAARVREVQHFYDQAAALVRCKPSNIAFTASATDAYTRALSSIHFVPGDVILTDRDDFISNQIQFLACQKRFGIKIEHIKDAAVGGVDLDDLNEKLHRLRPKLLAITHVPTNSGLVQPVKAIGEIYQAYMQKTGAESWYILDACQSVGQMKIDVNEMHCDFLSVTTRKFLRGPRGTGFLFISDHALLSGLEPLYIDMRGAEWVAPDRYEPRADARRFEDWEFAYATVVGSAAAIEYCRAVGEESIWTTVKALADYTRKELAQLARLRVLDRGPETCGLVTFTVDGGNADQIVSHLAGKKINVVPSYRNFAVFDFDKKGVEWAVRASPHYYNTIEEVDAFVAAMKEVV